MYTNLNMINRRFWRSQSYSRVLNDFKDMVKSLSIEEGNEYQIRKISKYMILSGSDISKDNRRKVIIKRKVYNQNYESMARWVVE